MRIRDFHPTIKVRIFEILFSKFAGDVINIFMPVYFAIHFGLAVAGIILAFNFLIANVAGIFSGYYTDLLGRKRLLVVAESVRLLAFCLLTFSNSQWLQSPTITFVSLIFIGVCYGLAAPANEAMLIDVSTPEQRDFVYTLYYWIRNLAYSIGGIVGGLMFKEHLFELFLLLTISSIVSTVLISFFVKEDFKKKKERNGQFFSIKEIAKSYSAILKDKVFLLYLSAVFLGFTLEHQLANYIAVRLEREMTEKSFFQLGDYHFSVDGVNLLGLLRAENSILVILLAVFITKFIRRLENKHSIYIGILLYAIGISVLAVSQSPVLLLVIMLVISIGELFSFPLMDAQLATIAPEESTSSCIAVREVTLQTGLVFSALGITAGTWLPSYAMAGIFLLMGLISVACFVSIFKAREEKMDKLRSINE